MEVGSGANSRAKVVKSKALLKFPWRAEMRAPSSASPGTSTLDVLVFRRMVMELPNATKASSSFLGKQARVGQAQELSSQGFKESTHTGVLWRGEGRPTCSVSGRGLRLPPTPAPPRSSPMRSMPLRTQGPLCRRAGLLQVPPQTCQLVGAASTPTQSRGRRLAGLWPQPTIG